MKLQEVIDTAVKSAAEARKEKLNSRDTAALFDDKFKDADHNTSEAKQKSVDFIKALADNDTTRLKDLSEGTDANGGYLTPPEFVAQLIEKKYQLPLLRQFATAFPMHSDTLELPAEGGAVDAYWTAELATATQSDPTFGNVILTANTLIGLSRMSRQVLADSSIQLLDFVQRRFASAIGRKEQAAFVGGTGTGQPRGFRQYTVASYAQAGASLTPEDLIEIQATLPEEYQPNAIWVMRRSAAKLIRKMRQNTGGAGTGGFMFDDNFSRAANLGPTGQNGLAFPTLLDRPVLILNDIPGNLGAGTNETEIWYGDYSYYLIGDRENVTAEISTQEGTSFVQHRTALKVVERVDGRLGLTDAFVKGTAIK
jgi:HK97 family phage major capsid protein